MGCVRRASNSFSASASEGVSPARISMRVGAALSDGGAGRRDGGGAARLGELGMRELAAEVLYARDAEGGAGRELGGSGGRWLSGA